MANLSLKIKADFDEAARQFKALAEESETAQAQIARFTEKFKTESIDKFIERQEMSAIAMQATGRETEGLNAQVSAYQREIERLIKAGLDPQDESLQRLQAEYITLKEKQEAANQATAAAAEAAKALAEEENAKAAALEKSAKATVELLTASSDHERQTIELRNRQRDLKEQMERLLRDGIDPQDESIQRLQAEYISLNKEQEAANQATKAETAARERLAKETVELLGVNSDHERQTITLRNRQRDLKEEMERLIRSGLSPQSEEVQRLTREHNNLERRVEASRKAQERKTKAVQAAKTALKAATVAVAGFATGMVALATRNANLAAGFENSARVVGMTTETFQELDYAMRMSGIQNGEYMLNRLNRSVIDVRNETGTLTKFLKENYHGLLEQLQGVENNEQAFSLMMDAISRAPNEFAATELAMAAFGRNGAQMVLAANQGADGINALREEARQLGIVSNENARAAMQFNDAMYRLRTAVQGIAQELTSQLLPAMTNIVIRATNAIQRFGEFRARLLGIKSVVKTIVPYIGGAAAGITTFIGTMKAVGIITTFIQKIKTLRNAMNALKASTVAATAAKKLAAYVKKLGVKGLVAFGVSAVAAAGAIALMTRRLREGIEEAKSFSSTFEDINFPAFSHMAEEVKDLDVALTQLSWGGAVAAIEAVTEASERSAISMYNSLKERLNYTRKTENQIKNEQINTIQSFLSQRLKLESEGWEERYAFLKEKLQTIKEYEHFTADERYLIEQELHRKIEGLQEERVRAAKESAKNMLKSYSTFFGGFSKLLGAAGRENRAFFMLSRKMALVQAGINTALAITKTLSTTPWPLNIPKAIGVGLKGAAQKAKIASSMIPSAETGGRFIVPNTTSRVDGVGLRVNPNERVDITPAGQAAGGGTYTFNLTIDGQILATAIRELARSGELAPEISLSGNL